MNIELTQNSLNSKVVTISKLALLKHCAFAGQWIRPTYAKYLKALGFAIIYTDYLHNLQNHFSEPIRALSDPTEKGQFSNIVGRGLSDYFAAKLDNIICTINYEAALRLLNIPITSSRPDLIGISAGDEIVAIEAKGYSFNACNQHFHNAVIQSQNGNIAVNSCIASISHNLYTIAKCRYIKTMKSNTINLQLATRLKSHYYSKILNIFPYRPQYDTTDIGNHQFYKIPLFQGYNIMDWRNNNLILLLPTIIPELAETGTLTQSFETVDRTDLYIGRDGIGICIE